MRAIVYFYLFPIFLCALFLFSAVPLFPRDVTISVKDADMDLPLDGASLHLWNNTTIKADEQGRAKLTVPDGPQVAIRISYPGYEMLRFVIPREGASFTVNLRLGAAGALENRELVFQAHTENDRLVSGQSVTVPEREFLMASEVGLVEDVMSVIKLLPGVGYAGLFNSQPSIRGGDPGDLTAVLDGFYIENPYHWGGTFSIFDPKMVESAVLSHGVFSARYGQTISGILQVTSKKAAHSYSELELGISTSAFNFAFSKPLGSLTRPSQSGGLSVFGKLSYWDGYVALMQGVAKFVPAIQAINAVKKAPYIRSAGISANYYWGNNLETIVNGYAGFDGVEAAYEYNDQAAKMVGDPSSSLQYKWYNSVIFFSTGLRYNPFEKMMLKATIGAGGNESVYELNIHRSYRTIDDRPAFSRTTDNVVTPSTSVQGRLEMDWALSPTLLFSAGIEEIGRQWSYESTSNLVYDWPVLPNSGTFTQIHMYNPNITNRGLFSSGWGIFEWKAPKEHLSTELGIRVDHVYFMAKDINIFSTPAINPRIHVKYLVTPQSPHIETMTFSAGTGLFSTMNQAVRTANTLTGLDDWKQTRAWTSVLAFKANMKSGYTLSVEAYYKYVFDRAYSDLYVVKIDTTDYIVEKFSFDGYGHIGGVDFMLQKFSGKKLNGWLTYSFNIIRYRNPEGKTAFQNAKFAEGYNGWYYPEFHRFHTLNLVLYYALNKKLTIYSRLGLVTGAPSLKHIIYPYDLYLPSSKIHKYYDDVYYSDKLRQPLSIPLDLKLSYQFYKPNGKTQGEWYIAIENSLILFIPKPDTRTVNPYTGKYEEGNDQPLYQLPIPMISFGFKWTY